MIASAGVFAAGVRLLMGNHGLWLAFALFMLARAATLLPAWPGLLGDAAPRRLQPDARSA